MSANHPKKPHRASSEPVKRGYKFERLIAWQKAMDFCERVHEVSMRLPKEEVYGLTSQFRRASVSIPLNIAEGSGCGSDREFSRFLSVALRSQYETIRILRLVERLGYLTPEESQRLEKEPPKLVNLYRV